MKKYGIALLYHFENLRFFAFFNAPIQILTNVHQMIIDFHEISLNVD